VSLAIPARLGRSCDGTAAAGLRQGDSTEVVALVTDASSVELYRRGSVDVFAAEPVELDEGEVCEEINPDRWTRP